MRKVEMFPSPATTNISNCAPSNTEHSGKFKHGMGFGVIGPVNFQNLFNSKFGNTAAFLNHIGGVIGGRTEKKMVRANTGRGITVMADIQTVGNGAKAKLVRDSVGIPSLTTNDDIAITANILSTGPKPTSRGFYYTFPKLDFKVSRTVNSGTALAAKLTFAISNHIVVSSEIFTAIWTLYRNSLCGFLAFIKTLSGAKLGFTSFNILFESYKGGMAELAILENLNWGNGILRLHGNYPFRVTPPATRNSAGALCC